MAWSIDEKRLLSLVRVGHRARVWALLKLRPNQYFTVEEIAETTHLAVRTVKDALSFIQDLPNIEKRAIQRKSSWRCVECQ